MMSTNRGKSCFARTNILGLGRFSLYGSLQSVVSDRDVHLLIVTHATCVCVGVSVRVFATRTKDVKCRSRFVLS